ncbi:MAG: CDP-diacylglycerol--glycerol-3-phosphate 3-phosphatidyltransferase [Oscillospiraceae bacterium]
MNLPNKLTILRVLMVPVFVFFLLNTTMKNNYLYANIVFILASLTDALDGYIARKYNLITNFGKFLDPLADKILVAAALICFIELKIAPSVAVLIIISREFIVSALRLVSNDSGVVIPANIWGKIKTILQMVLIVVILTLCQIVKNGADINIEIISSYLVWFLALITFISGLTYLYDSRKIIDVNN